MIIRYTTQFKKDYKRIKKQNKDIRKIKHVIENLASGVILDSRFRDHGLTGGLKEFRNCHIEPDWILIYKLTHDTLILLRTGSHSELFR